MAKTRTSSKRRNIAPLPPIVPQDLREAIEDLTYAHRHYGTDAFHHLRVALAYMVRQDLRSKEQGGS